VAGRRDAPVEDYFYSKLGRLSVQGENSDTILAAHVSNA